VAAGDAAGLARNALHLVRPDSYVALAAPAGDPKRLRRHFLELGLSATPLSKVRPASSFMTGDSQ